MENYREAPKLTNVEMGLFLKTPILVADEVKKLKTLTVKDPDGLLGNVEECEQFKGVLARRQVTILNNLIIFVDTVELDNEEFDPHYGVIDLQQKPNELIMYTPLESLTTDE